MGGNPKLKGLGKDDTPHALRLEGPIVDGQCWIDVVVANPLVAPQAFHRVKALIDTGATSSSISSSLAKQIGLTARTRGRVSGASGVQPCEVAPGVVGFELQDGTIAHRIVALSILPMHVPLLFGMAEIMTGYLVIDGPKKLWRWTLPKASVDQGPLPSAAPKP